VQLDRRLLLAALPLGVWSMGLSAAAAAAEPFDAWLDGVRRQALAAGISRRTVDEALRGLLPIPTVIELVQRQPEGQMSFVEYRARVVTDQRIERGAELLLQNRNLLDRVQARYGVPPTVVVALWGIESNFGRTQGSYSVVGALATLAHEGRRADLFRAQLLKALMILDHGDIASSGMVGSWAGAMGQCQFMPSTYLAYAVDGDGDGRRDIWTSLPDVFASISNFLSSTGWNARYIWGRPVQAPDRVADREAGLDGRAPLATWSRRGLRRADGGPLPVASIDAALLRMDGSGSADFLVYHNFRTLMVWNRSTYFALSVGLLADALGAATTS
jgi:membrane-bound lytic murein transglycosylase B